MAGDKLKPENHFLTILVFMFLSISFLCILWYTTKLWTLFTPRYDYHDKMSPRRKCLLIFCLVLGPTSCGKFTKLSINWISCVFSTSFCHSRLPNQLGILNIKPTHTKICWHGNFFKHFCQTFGSITINCSHQLMQNIYLSELVAVWPFPFLVFANKSRFALVSNKNLVAKILDQDLPVSIIIIICCWCGFARAYFHNFDMVVLKGFQGWRQWK